MFLKCQTYIAYYYTDIYFDISCKGGGGGGDIHFLADCLGGGIMKICMDLGGDIKKRAAEKKSSAPPCSIHN